MKRRTIVALGTGIGLYLAMVDLYRAANTAKIRAEYRAEVYRGILDGVMEELNLQPLLPNM